jgi:SAM-dependent methyltransferase
MSENPFDSPEVAERWRQNAAARAAYLQPATDRMLDAAGLALGGRVLDLGTGTGDTALLAALRVGPDGRVLATDISLPMVRATEEAARAAGLANIQVQLADAAALELETGAYDSVIARFSLMFVPDLGAALAGIRRVVRGGGRLAALVWGPAAANPFLALAPALARRTGRLRVPEQQVNDPLRLGDGEALAAAARQAGWDDVVVEPIALERRFPNAQAAFDAIWTSPLGTAVAGALEGDDLARYVEDLRAEVDAAGLTFPGLALLLRARNLAPAG